MTSFYTNIQVLGDKILYRGYENDQSITTKEEFSPTLFVKSNTKTKHRTLDGTYVQPVKFSGCKEAKEFLKRYEEVNNFEIYGNDRFLYQYISKQFPEEINYDFSKIKIATIDIETTSENGFPKIEDATEEILCITVKDFTSKKILVWGQKEYQNNRQDIVYETCWDEETLLKNFHTWWVYNTPDILTGWNIKFFDIPYICKRLNRVLGEKFMNSLSPWNKVNEEEYNISGRKTFTFNILGISTLDYLELYKKFTYSSQESYRLDHIASVELGEAKLDHSEYETFKEFYTKNWQKFVAYNIHDVELVDQLEDKMKLIELAVTMAYDAKVNYEDVYSQVRTWDAIIYNYLLKKNIVIPPNKKNTKDSQYAGAYVKEPIPGMYHWVLSLDLTSLYPSLIMQYNISPETLLEKRYPGIDVDKLLNKEVVIENVDGKCVCANGCMYDTTKKGIFPELVEKIFNERQFYKKEMLKEKSKLEKIELELKNRGVDLNNL